ncbi:hypothetical protein [Shewanella sp. GXUN23E]|uniref:hypothetical protein n=1 Tax=Shewanella sp. GXUN23E TaxID=3422498 RepID=UPI003D7D42FD
MPESEPKPADNSGELHPGMYHPAAFYVPSARASPPASQASSVQPTELSDYRLSHHEVPRSWEAVLIVLLFVICLVHWLWQQRH